MVTTFKAVISQHSCDNHMHHKVDSYQRQHYQQATLPPGVPISSTPSHTLNLSLHSPTFLNNSKPLSQVSFYWWGMPQPQKVQSPLPLTLHYPLAVPLPLALQYLSDMKVLLVEMQGPGAGNKVIGRINFAVINGWQGQELQQTISLNSNGKKVGEMDYSISIDHAPNSSRGNQSVGKTQKEMVFELRQKGQRVSSETEDKPTLPTNAFQNHQGSSLQQVQTQHHRPPRSPPFPQQLSHIEENINLTSPIAPLIPQTQPQQRRQAPQSDTLRQGTVHEWNQAKYEAQLIRLAEDYALLIQNHNGFKPQQANTIQILIEEIVINRRESKESTCLIKVPLPSQAVNQYQLGKNGIVKVVLNQPQEKLVEYLKECKVHVECKDMHGSVALWKLLAHIGHSSTVNCEHINKNNGKGKQRHQITQCTVILKAIPPPSLPSPSLQKQEANKGNAHHKENVIDQPTQQYALVYLHGFHPLDQHYPSRHHQVSICQFQQTLVQSQTAFNTTAATFNQALPCTIISAHVTLDLWHKGNPASLIGRGQLKMDTPLSIAHEVGIVSQKGHTIGYIVADYVRNGLGSITAMMSLLTQTQQSHQPSEIQGHKQPNKNKENLQQNQQNRHKKNHQGKDKEQHNHKSKEEKQQEDISSESKEQVSENESELSEHQPSNEWSSVPNPSPPVSPVQPHYLQAYNLLLTQIFTQKIILPSSPVCTITVFSNAVEAYLKQNGMHRGYFEQLCVHLLGASSHPQKIDLQALNQDLQAFGTYYEDAIQQRNHCMAQIVEQISHEGLSFIDLECELTDKADPYMKLTQILPSQRQFIATLKKLQDLKQPVGYELVQSLRNFEIYEDTEGSVVNWQTMSELVTDQTINILTEIDDAFKPFMWQEALQKHGIQLSQWQKVNIKHNLPPISHRSSTDHKPTISKSPTFGHLHQINPTRNQEEKKEDQNMTESLGQRMIGLPISPIQHQPNSVQKVSVKLQNLTSPLLWMRVEGQDVKVSGNCQNWWNSDSQNTPHHESQSVGEPKSSKAVGGTVHISKAFSYRVETELEDKGPIEVICAHGEWTALVSHQGEYLGAISLT